MVDPILFPTLEFQTSDACTTTLRFLPLLGNIAISGYIGKHVVRAASRIFPVEQRPKLWLFVVYRGLDQVL